MHPTFATILAFDQKHCPDLRGLRHLESARAQNNVMNQKHCPDLRGLRPIVWPAWNHEWVFIRSIAPIWGDYDFARWKAVQSFGFDQKHCPDLRGLRPSVTKVCFLTLFRIRSIAPIWGDYDSLRSLIIICLFMGSEALPRFEGITTHRGYLKY